MSRGQRNRFAWSSDVDGKADQNILSDGLVGQIAAKLRSAVRLNIVCPIPFELLIDAIPDDTLNMSEPFLQGQGVQVDTCQFWIRCK